MTVTEGIPIGVPLSNYHCIIKDEFSQNVIINQEGELYVGGVGVFAGYLGRDDLTAKVLIEIDGELFYRTGDLVRMDHNGLLHYQGRKDHQIKLHGQRIELGEIERCLLNTSVSACIVMKWSDDHLVAYVQTSQMNEEQLRQHCQSHLPPHMIPSIFIILEKLPLNANGKIDRKRLPSPDFSSLTPSSTSETDTPHNQLEERVHDVWCQVLRRDGQRIPTTTSFFSIGGHSLLFIELYHRYQSLFHFDTRELSIAPFLQQPTIVQHARLLQQITTNDMKSTQWHTLHITQGNIVYCSLTITYKMFDYETFRYRIICSRAHLS
jgi:tyrocidine synthetase-3